MMADKPTPKEPENVACEVCLKEIPESVAVSQEGNEYVHHFCGIECYDQWRQRQDSESES